MASVMMLVTLTSCSANRPSETDFVVLYTEGLYNFVFPHDFKTGKPRPGQANFMSLVRQQRAIYKNRCIVLDGGNRLLGALPSRYSEHIDTLSEPLSFKADRIVGYDATGIGRTDLESDILFTDRWDPSIQPPFVCANLLNRKDGRPIFKPYVIMERDGIRIAIFGMTSPSETQWLPKDTWKKIEIQDMIECAQQWMPRIKASNPDLIIGMFNCTMNYEGRGLDIDSYKNPNGGIPAAIRVPGFDLVLLGDSRNEEIRILTDDEGRHVTCLAAGEAAHFCGNIRIHMSKKSDGTYHKRIFASVTQMDQFAPDPEFMALTKPDFDKIYNWQHTPIAYLADTIIGWKGFYGPDQYRELINKTQMWYVPEADISVASCFIGKDTIYPGPITPFTIQSIYPYENHLRTIYMTGDDIVRFLEWATNLQFATMKDANSDILNLHHDKKGHLMYDDEGVPRLENSPSYFSCIRGIRYQVDLSKEFGNRVKVLSMSDGRPFLPNKRYLMAINSHQVLGGGKFFSEGLGWDDETMSLHIEPRKQTSLRFVMYDYLNSLPKDTLRLTLDRNWEILPASWHNKACNEDKDLGNNLPRW